MAKNEAMEADKGTVVQLLEAFGVKKAGKMSDKELVKKVTADFVELFDEGKDQLDKDARAWCKDLVKAIKAKTKITLVSEDDEEEEDEEDEKKTAKKDKKSKKEEDDEEEDEPKKGKKSKDKDKKKGKTGGIKKEGKIDYIIAMLEEVSEKGKTITRERMLEKMVKKFPDSEESAMKETIKCQTGYQLKAKKDINVIRDEDGGYYIGKGKKKKK